MTPLYVAKLDKKTGKTTDVEAYQTSNVDTSEDKYTFGKAGGVQITLPQGFNGGKPLTMQYFGSSKENLVSSTRTNSELHQEMTKNCKTMNVLNGVDATTNLWNLNESRRIEGLRRADELEKARKAEQEKHWRENPAAKAESDKRMKEQQAAAREARLLRFAPKPIAVPVPASIVVTPESETNLTATTNDQRIIIFKGVRYLLDCGAANYMKNISDGADQISGIRFHLEIKGKDIKIPSTYTLGYLAHNTTVDDELIVVEDNSGVNHELSAQLFAFCKNLSA